MICSKGSLFETSDRCRVDLLGQLEPVRVLVDDEDLECPADPSAVRGEEPDRSGADTRQA